MLKRFCGPAEARFWAKVDRWDPDHCWLWTAKLSKGYGSFRASGPGEIRRSTPAYRFAYESLVGPIPEGLDLDHLCRVRACVNPKHLEPVTRQINILRGNGRSAIAFRTGMCGHGHSLEDAYVSCNGTKRKCRPCTSRRTRERYPTRRGVCPHCKQTFQRLDSHLKSVATGKVLA